MKKLLLTNISSDYENSMIQCQSLGFQGLKNIKHIYKKNHINHVNCEIYTFRDGAS